VNNHLAISIKPSRKIHTAHPEDESGREHVQLVQAAATYPPENCVEDGENDNDGNSIGRERSVHGCLVAIRRMVQGILQSGPCRKALVLLLKNALERVFVLGSKRKDIRHFLLGFFARVGAASSFSLIVDAIHLRNGFVVGHPKETFQHTNDEIHWSTVVIQQRYVEAREVRHLWGILAH